MNTNQTNMQYTEGEIELKELILALWKRKVMIISITMIFAILAGLYTIFLVSPVYNTKLNIIVSMPERYQTKYGEYVLPISTNEQYIQLFKSDDVLVKTINDLSLTDKINVEALRERISIRNVSNNVQNGNTFEVIISFHNSVDSLELAKVLYSNYIEFLDIMTKEQVVNYFYNNFSVELITLEDDLNQERKSLATNEELFHQIEKELGVSGSNVGIVEHIGEEGNYVVPVHTINPNYIKLETDIISNKQMISNLINSIDMKKAYIVELEKQKQTFQTFYETGKMDDMNINITSVVETNIHMPSLPVAPSSKAGPSTVLNVAIGTVLGGILGAIVALFQWYWRKE